MGKMFQPIVGNVYEGDEGVLNETFEGDNGSIYRFCSFAKGTYVRKGEAVYFDADGACVKATGVAVNGVCTQDVNAISAAAYALVMEKGTYGYIGVTIASTGDLSKKPLIQSFVDGKLEDQLTAVAGTGNVNVVVATGVVANAGATTFLTQLTVGDTVLADGTNARAIIQAVTTNGAAVAVSSGTNSNNVSYTIYKTGLSRRPYVTIFGDGSVANCSSRNGTGTLAAASSTTITGTNTNLLAEIREGDYVNVNSSVVSVSSITNADTMVVNAAVTCNVNTFTYWFRTVQGKLV